MQALARRLGCKYLDLAGTRVDPVALELISERDARRYSAIPVGFVDEHTVLVAMADPSNIVAIDDLRILTGFDIEPAIATERRDRRDAEQAAVCRGPDLRRPGHQGHGR